MTRRMVPLVRRGSRVAAVFVLLAVSALAIPARASAQPRPAASMRFTDARLEDVITALGQMLGLTVVTSEIPDRRISLVTPAGVRGGEISGILESLLEANGLVLLRRGAVVQVVPAEKAPGGGEVGVGFDFPDPPPVGIVTRLVPLQFLRAEEALDALKSIAGPAARFEAVNRSNALLISDRGANVARYLELLRRLDVATQGDDGLRTYVIPLRYASSEDLAAALGQLFGATVGAGRRGSLDDLSLSANLQGFRSRENEIFRTRQNLQQAAPGGTSPTAPTGGGVTGNVVTPSRGDSARGGLVGQTTIVSNAPGNSLVIRTAPGNIGLLRETIDSLDRRPDQVLIEVTVAEVVLGRGLEYGVDWSAAATRARTQGGVTFGRPVVDSLNLFDAAPQNFIANLTRLGSIDVRAVLRALASTSEVKVLSTPEVLAVNNREARILVGSKFPFVASTRLGVDFGGRDQSVQYQDIGTSLRLIPTINDQDYVSVQVLQEVSSVTTQTVQAALNAPVINTREASTRAVVKDGQTVVIGGLIGQSDEVIEGGVPFLKDLPLLGYLFKRQSRSRARTELAIFITPYIIRSDADADSVRERARRRVGGIEQGDAAPRAAPRAEPLRPLPPEPRPARAPVAPQPAPAPGRRP